jgi:hypothetical protein
MDGVIACSYIATIAVSAALTACLLRFKGRLGIVDVPNERSSHDRPKPRTGGMGIMGAVLFGWALLFASGELDLTGTGSPSWPWPWVLAGAGAFFVLGLLDDADVDALGYREARRGDLRWDAMDTSQAPRIMVYSRTAGYRHDSIPAGTEALRELGAEHGWTVRATEDPAERAAGLDGCRAVVFLSTSGEVLAEDGRAALRAYMAGGGAFVGVHAAACTEYDWPWYGELVGARFDGHPDADDTPPPLLGEHTRSILETELGLDADRVSALEAQGVVRCHPGAP